MGLLADPIAWAPLPPESQVYRAYPFADSLNAKTGKPLPKLFYRKQNETGLSVGLSREGLLARYPGAAGMCRLNVGSAVTPGVGVLGCSDPLSIVQDDLDHAEIRGIPTRQEDQEKALRTAKYLTRIAQNC